MLFRSCCQKNGWFDETVITKWVDAVVGPYVTSYGKAFLLIDHYKVHLMSKFVRACNDYGVDVDYIPAGYTCVLQPVDVGFNALFKKYVRDQYHNWSLHTYQGIGNGVSLPTPTREHIDEWVNKAHATIPEVTVTRTFRSIGYNWTPLSTQLVTTTDNNVNRTATTDTDVGTVEYSNQLILTDRN